MRPALRMLLPVVFPTLALLLVSLPCFIPTATTTANATPPPNDLTQPVRIPSGVFTMGSEKAAKRGQGSLPPQRKVRVSSFEIDATTASNAEFALFVAESGYKTDSEKFGWSFVLEPHATPEAVAATCLLYTSDAADD